MDYKKADTQELESKRRALDLIQSYIDWHNTENCIFEYYQLNDESYLGIWVDYDCRRTNILTFNSIEALAEDCLESMFDCEYFVGVDFDGVIKDTSNYDELHKYYFGY